MFRKTLKTAVGAFNKVCNLLLGIVMVAMFLVLLLQIISRFIAFIPLPWSQDLIVFLLICSVFLGACTATANNKQIRLEFFVDLLPKKLTKVILIIADLISIAFLVVVTATAAAIGGIMVEPMEKAGYKKEYTAAVIASSGLLGLIIPPSGTMLMYAIVADVSVLEMFTGGIIPGIIMGLSLMVVEYFRAKKNGYGTSELDIAEFHTQSKAKIVIQSFLALLSPVIILGGIYSGKFTATEAAGVSVLYGFIIGYFVFKQLNIKKAYEACVKTGVSTSMILFLIGAAAVFGWMLTMQQIPNQIVAAISGITNSPAVVLLLVNLALFVAGALLDNVAAITLLTPVLVPLISAYGIDKTFFGIIMIINLSIGQITPPIGMNLFVSSSICEVRLEKVIRQVLPFLAVLIVDLFLFTYIPGIVTVLPNALLH